MRSPNISSLTWLSFASGFILSSLLFLGCAGNMELGDFILESVASALRTPLEICVRDVPFIVKDMLLLAEALTQEDEKPLCEFIRKHEFARASISGDVYAHALLESTKRLVVSTDSMKITFSDTLKEIASMLVDVSARDPKIDEDSLYDYDEADPFITLERLNSDCWELCVPTLAEVRVTMLLVDTVSDDSSSFVNLVFFEKKQETWTIVSFEKDLLDILEGRQSSGG